MRFGYEYFDKSYEEEADALSLWDVCSHAKAGLFYSEAALDIRSRALGGRGIGVRQARELLSRAEGLTQTIFLGLHLNLSWYLDPTALSFAPFFHLSHLAHALRTRPELHPHGDAIDDMVVGVKGLEDQMQALNEYLESDEVPPRPGSEERLRHPRGTRLRCNLATTALLFARADVLRLRLGTPWPEREGDEVRRLLQAGEVCLRRTVRDALPIRLILFVAASPVPLFEVLDRLDRQVALPLVLDVPNWAGVPFRMHVLPSHNVEAGHVRSMLQFHCDASFKELLHERRQRRGPGAPFLVVEVGAHLGGCSFYALTHLDAGIRALAVEPYGPAAAAMRRTAADNGLSGRFQVAESFITDDSLAGTAAAPSYTVSLQSTAMAPWLHQPTWAPGPEGERAGAGGLHRGARLDAVLRERGVAAVDLLRVHVLGRELSALRSAEALFRAGLVGAVAVAIFGLDDGLQDAAAIGRFLHSHGLSLRYQGLRGAAAEAVLAGGGPGRPKGTSTLVAVAEGP